MRYEDKENYVHLHSVEWRRGHIYTTLFDEHRAYLSDTVLQLGCNAGTTLAVLASGWADWYSAERELVGWDCNPTAVVAANDLLDFYPHARARHRNLLAPIVHAAICRTVLALDVVEHIWPEDHLALQTNLRRMLAPGGHLWVFVPRAGGKMDTDPTHVAHFAEMPELIEAVTGRGQRTLEAAGWRLVHSHHETRENPDPSICPGVHDGLFLILERL